MDPCEQIIVAVCFIGGENHRLVASHWLYHIMYNECTPRLDRDSFVSRWPWLYGSWIYNCLCNQCLSPLTWVRISIKARCTLCPNEKKNIFVKKQRILMNFHIISAYNSEISSELSEYSEWARKKIRNCPNTPNTSFRNSYFYRTFFGTN
jgi:hypothetical protein